MSLTLYRKYRPQTFKDLIGQNHIKITLQNELETGKIAHAYLFSGPRGLGKTTTARLLAKAVNCLNRKDNEHEPCNTCDACLEVKENKSLDIIEIDAASHTGVDNVRENIINNSRFTPTNRKYKVFIIDEVHMLSIPAFNALLKTLEEPPAHAIFILATTEIHKVPPTIISRCQRFDFRKVSKAELLERLNHIATSEKKKVDKSILENIANYAEGCFRDAETLLEQILSLDEKEITAEQAELVIPISHLDLVLEFINHLIKKDCSQAINLVNKLVQDGIDLQNFTTDLIETLRKIMLIKVNDQLDEFTHTLDQKLEKEVLNISKIIELPSLILMINLFIEAKRDLKSSEILQLPLEMAAVQLCNDVVLETVDVSNDNDKTGGSVNTASKPNTSTKPEAKIDSAPVQAVKAEDKLIQNPIGKIKLTIEHIKEKWEEVLVCIKDYNHSLASTLRLHQPTAVKEDGTVEICFKYKFHQQRVNDIKNKQAVEKILEQVFKTPIRVKTIIVTELEEGKTQIEGLTQSKEDDKSVDTVLKAFGGQVVE